MVRTPHGGARAETVLEADEAAEARARPGGLLLQLRARRHRGRRVPHPHEGGMWASFGTLGFDCLYLFIVVFLLVHLFGQK